MELQPIAYFHSPLTSKFGIPKQSGLVEELHGEIVFTPAFRNPDYLRGLEEFDYIWLLWEFSANPHSTTQQFNNSTLHTPHSPLVRPPVLGGNVKKGVFATRSPFRPNPIGLSSVKIERIEFLNSQTPIIHVCGADLMDGTPIFDIKPYISYADSHPDARCGFADRPNISNLEVVIPPEVARLFSSEELDSLRPTLALDPRPRYQDNPQKIYGMPFAGYDVHFRVEGNTLLVTDATNCKKKDIPL